MNTTVPRVAFSIRIDLVHFSSPCFSSTTGEGAPSYLGRVLRTFVSTTLLRASSPRQTVVSDHSSAVIILCRTVRTNGRMLKAGVNAARLDASNPHKREGNKR